MRMPERFSESGEREFTSPEADRPKQPSRREFLKLAGLTAAGLAAETVGFRTEARAQGQTVSLKGMRSREARERVRGFKVKVGGLAEPTATELARELAALMEAEARQLGREPKQDALDFVVELQNISVSEKQSRIRREAAEEVGRQTNRIPTNPQVMDNSTAIGRMVNGAIGVWARSKKQEKQKEAEQAIAPIEGEALLQYQIQIGTEVRRGRVTLHYKNKDQTIMPQKLELAAGVSVSVSPDGFKNQGDSLRVFIAQELVRAASGPEQFTLSDAIHDHALRSSEATGHSAADAPPRKRPRPE